MIHHSEYKHNGDFVAGEHKHNGDFAAGKFTIWEAL